VFFLLHHPVLIKWLCFHRPPLSLSRAKEEARKAKEEARKVKLAAKAAKAAAAAKVSALQHSTPHFILPFPFSIRPIEGANMYPCIPRDRCRRRNSPSSAHRQRRRSDMRLPCWASRVTGRARANRRSVGLLAQEIHVTRRIEHTLFPI